MRKHDLAALILSSTLLGACSLLVDTDGSRLSAEQRATSVGNGTDDSDATGQESPEDAASCERCDDGIACTLDACGEEAECSNVPSDARCGSDERCSVVKGCVPLRCRDDSDCDDGNACSGTERCDPASESADPRTGCVAAAPLTCDDGIACTKDSCVRGVGCTHDADSTRCSDDVGCTVDVCDPEQGCTHSANDARCDFCQPGSICDDQQGCIGGFRNDCSDGDSCTVDSCDVATASCQHFGDCEAGPDTCESARVLALSNGRAVAGGSFARVTPTYDTHCAKPGGRDAFYQLKITELSDVFIDTTLSNAATSVAVASRCDAQGFELGCAGEQGDGETGSRLIIHRYDPAVMGPDLFVMVDAVDDKSVGDYILTVDVAPVASDLCANDSLALGKGATLLGFMDKVEPLDASGVESGSCQVDVGNVAPPETVVRVLGGLDGSLTLTAESGAFSPVLYARSKCGGNPADELGCSTALVPNNDNSNSNRVQLELPVPPNQEAVVVVDGGKSGAPFLLRVLP